METHHYRKEAAGGHPHSPPEWSGAGERHGVEGPGERLWVGEPERLSLDDWWKPEEKLRLLCMGGGGVCLDSFFKMLRRRLHRKREGSGWRLMTIECYDVLHRITR